MKLKKVYEDMCDEDRFQARPCFARRRALQSYLLYDARGTAAIFGLPGKSTGEGSISSINTACALTALAAGRFGFPAI